jgi:hypothetical protein
MKDLRTNLVACCVSLVGCMVPRPGAGGSDEAETSSGGADGSSGDAGSLGGSMTSSSNGGGEHDTDSDDPSTSGSSGGPPPDEGTSTGAVDDPCQGTCAAAFEGWSGPAVAHRAAGSEVPLQCDGDFAHEVADAFTSFTADPAQCDCSCGAAVGVSCGNGVTVHRYSGNCIALQASYVAGPNCTDIPDITTDSTWRFETPTPSGGACDPSGDTALPQPRFLDRVRLCEPEVAPAGTCDEGQCVPTPSPEQGGLCYWAPGELECPIGERTLLFDGSFEEGRSCGACECGAPTGECVFENEDLVGAAFSVGNCGGLGLVATFAADQCTMVTGDVSALIAAMPTPDVDCAPSGGAPLGEAVPTGVTTMCCIE